MRNVDGRRLRGERGLNTLRLGVPLAEGLKGGDGLCGTKRVRRSELRCIRMGRTFGKTETRVDTGKILCEGEVNDRCDARRGHSRRPWPLLWRPYWLQRINEMQEQRELVLDERDDELTFG